MPKIIIVAGPNGAGKTSFANEFLPRHRETFAYVNADEIARSLPTDEGLSGRDVLAARLMLANLRASAERLDNIMPETTRAAHVCLTSDHSVHEQPEHVVAKGHERRA